MVTRDDVLNEVYAETVADTVARIDSAPPGLRIPDLADLVEVTEAAFLRIRREVPEVGRAVRRYQRRHPVKRSTRPDAIAEREATARQRKTVYRLTFSKDDELVEKLEKIESLPTNGHILSVVGNEPLAIVAGEALDEIAALRAQVVDLTRQVYKAKYALASRISRQSPQRPTGGFDKKQGLSDEYAVGFD